MERITKAFLQAQVDRLNRTMGTPLEPYTKGEDGHYHANIGCYHLSQAYGGFALYQMVNDDGGARDIFGYHMPKRELSDRISAYLAGIDAAKQ